jgi:adenine-specific DNA-methyltransferase
LKNSNYSDWSKEDLVKEIKKLKKRKKYGIVWDEEKTKEKFDIDSENKLPILKEVKSKEIQTDENSSSNILIEGDNYHSLSVLNYTHAKQVDVIYIDPPYNTGKEFRYNDRLIDLEDTYRHSKWLSFMKKRLVLARKLLKNSGVIFISIDDNEQATLKILCDEVFGPGNFIANIIWQKKYSPQNDAKYFSDMHDFIVVFAKKKNQGTEKNGWVRNLIPRTDEMNARYKNPDNDPRGLWKPADLSVKRVTEKDTYEILTPNGRKVLPPKGRSWVTSKERVKEWIGDNRIWFGKTGNNVPSMKIFLNEVQQGLVPTTWWNREFAGHNQDAKQEINKLNLKQLFETPKPVKLIQRILQIATNKNDIILDSFAGSGTTAQAVLELNKEDGGNRKFILVELEPEICKNITSQRVKKVIKGYEDVSGTGGGFQYAVLDKKLFNSDGTINDECTFEELASYLYFRETKTILDTKKIKKTLLDTHNDTQIHLMFDGIGKNNLDRKFLSTLDKNKDKIIYADKCTLDDLTLEKHKTVFKQIPYEVKKF